MIEQMMLLNVTKTRKMADDHAAFLLQLTVAMHHVHFRGKRWRATLKIS